MIVFDMDACCTYNARQWHRAVLAVRTALILEEYSISPHIGGIFH
jgi:hypothetical protein